MLLARSNAQHPRRAIAHLDGHSEPASVAGAHEERAVGLAHPRVGGEIGHHERLAGLRHPAAEALTDPESPCRYDLARVAAHPRDDQLVAFDEAEPHEVGPEQAAARLRDPLEQRLQWLDARELARGLEQRLEAPLKGLADL